MKRVAMLIGLIALLIPGRAELGRIHYDEIKLDDVLSMTPSIVVVRPGPTMEQETIELGEGIEPFVYPLYRYEVVEHLRPPRPAKEGETVLVTGFDQGRLDLHVKYHAWGMHKSPIWTSYTSAHPPGPSEEMILFLRRGVYLAFDPASEQLTGRADTWMPVVAGAAEGPDARPKLDRKASQPCGCVDDLSIAVGYPGEPDDTSSAVDDALRAKFSDEGMLSWSTINIRPQLRQ